MSREEFLEQLRNGLSGLSQDDIEERLTFYSEMIEDGKEEGLSEEQAVAAVGAVDEIVTQAVAESDSAKAAKEPVKSKKRLSVGEIILLVLGSPIWLSLGIAAFAVIISLYFLLWAVIISLWAVFASTVASSIAGVLACVFHIAGGNGSIYGIAMLAAGIVCAGLSVLMFYVCKAVTTWTVMITKKIAIWIKNALSRRGQMKKLT